LGVGAVIIAPDASAAEVFGRLQIDFEFGLFIMKSSTAFSENDLP
jgi:hypothetical protein